ncbi:MAG: histidine kinase [Candidatus Aminicenantes bacterium]|nr:histidine kinase [Candidatus Aminicenantes bacterium]
MKKLGQIFTSRIAYHMYFWIFFFGLIFLSSGAKEESLTVRVVQNLEYIAFLIVPVYFHFLILDRFFYKKKYALYVVFLVAILFGWGYLVDRFFYQRHMEKSSLVSAIVMIFFMLLITTSFKVLADSVKQRFLMQQIEAKQVQTELRLLKAQINPHFLFNTLNNLFGMARKQDPQTADSIAGLSHLMRYMIYESNVELISLEKEIQQINRLIELQKLRFTKDDDVQIDFAIDGEAANAQIPPMLLIPFVENAFKHGISLATPSFVRIHLNVDEDKLEFSVSNSKHSRSENKEEEGLGIGLQNVNRRLELLYPGKHELAISDGEKVFEVRLVLRNV